MPAYWLSTERMTVAVECDQFGNITLAPPIVRKFIGQPIRNLACWLKKQPGYKASRLND